MFKEMPQNKASISQRNKIYGIGINDANYMTCKWINGKRCFCSIYKIWHSMMARCYSDPIKKRTNAYSGCTVSNEWLHFSIFKEWVDLQDWKGMQLDKDILIPGNKVYSKESCIFVTGPINKLLLKRLASRGEYLIGVDKRKGRFRAQCADGNGKQKHLGFFDTEKEAHKAYVDFKYKIIISVANKQDDRLKDALYRHAELLMIE